MMSRSRAPELVGKSDIMEFALDGEPVDPRGRKAHLERFIHAALYEARPDIQSVGSQSQPQRDSLRHHGGKAQACRA